MKNGTNDNELINAFSDSIKNESIEAISNLGEVALDCFIDSDIVKEIPILNTVISLYKIGHSIWDAFYIKKLATFIDEINKNAIKNGSLEKYKKKMKDNSQKLKKEMEYILVLINRYIDYDKSIYLAKLYISYLENVIDWKAFIKYAQVIDQLFSEDLKVLLLEGVVLSKRKDSDDVLRLSALGLLVEVNNAPKFEVNDQTGELYMNTSHNEDEVEYEITEFGKVLAVILKEGE